MNEILLYESGDLDVGELTPETLSDAHPLWEKGVEFLGPWERVPGEDAARWGLEGARLWRAREEGPLPRLLIIRTCGSTMDFVRGLAETGRWPAWGAVLSVEQPLGVGRMGSRWCSGPGNLHVSWLWPRAEGEEDLDGLVPLAAGHGAALGLERLGLKDVRVKWPNDLLWREGKAGGILVQDRQGATVAGLGLNLAFSPGEEEMEEREEGAPRPVSFYRDMPPHDPVTVGNELVDSIRKWYEELSDYPSQEDRVRAMSGRMAWIGRRVRLRTSMGERQGLFAGLAPDGGLVLIPSFEADEAGTQEKEVFHSGSLFLD